MTEPKTTRDQLLGRALPVKIESYTVERFLSGGDSYADYDAHHRTLGHRLLFRHERWAPSTKPTPARTSGRRCAPSSRRQEGKASKIRARAAWKEFRSATR
jgi:hypothetical protein